MKKMRIKRDRRAVNVFMGSESMPLFVPGSTKPEGCIDGHPFTGPQNRRLRVLGTEVLVA